MNVKDFLAHWGIAENPFAAEEARHDAIFSRLAPDETSHPDFEKILGALERPSTSIVFGEKGSGKTAIRLQIADRIARWNDRKPDRRVLFAPYDDINPFLDRVIAAVEADRARPKDRRSRRQRDEPHPVSEFSLADHMDAVLRLCVSRLVEELLAESADASVEPPASLLRHAPVQARADALLLQALYDEPQGSRARSRRLRKRLRLGSRPERFLWRALAATLWIVPLFIAYMRDFFIGWSDTLGRPVWLGLVIATALLWAAVLVKATAWDRWRPSGLARRLARSLRALGLDWLELRDRLASLPASDRAAAAVILDDPLDARYAMFDRLRSAAREAGCVGAVVVVDRVDEPVAITGDTGRMRALIWPLLSNKFLQMEGFGFKLLLPIELRYALMRETSAFFQEARLDKQALIEQLAWTGATLYDLCNARLRAAHGGEPAAEPPSLQDLFDDEVARQDLIDALDQMRQPRDAFKMLYQCIQEHCARVTSDQPTWRIPRHVLDTVRRSQAERVQMLARGVRPA